MTASPPSSATRPDRLTTLSLVALAVIWGANFSIVKVALEDLSPIAFNALRFPVASLLLYAILRAKGQVSLPARADVLRIVGLGVLGNVLYQNLFIFGLALTSAGNGSLLLSTVPIWTVLLSVFLGHERPSPLVWTGVLATMAGMILVVVGGPGLRLGGASLLGDLLMVGAAIAWSFYTVGARNLIRRYGPLRVTAWTLWVGTIGLVLLGLPAIFRTPLGDVSVGSWLAVLYAGCFALTTAYVIWTRGVERIGSARTAAYSNLVPVVAMLVAWPWLGERPSAVQLGGAGVILAGISLAGMGTSKQRG